MAEEREAAAAMRFGYQLLAVAASAFAVDVVGCIHVLALVNKSAALAVGTLVLLRLACFPGQHWFIQHETVAARLLLTLAGAVGAGLGTLTVILLA